MRKIALVALATICAPLMAEDMPEEATPSVKLTDNTEEAPLVAELDSARGSAPDEPVLSADSIGTANKFISLVQNGDFEDIEANLDYDRMHKAYVKQMVYVSGKIDNLSSYVDSVAAGTFETKVREGSMMLGLVGEQLQNVISDTKTDPDGYKKYLKLKFASIALPDVKLSAKLEDGVILIEAKAPYSDSSDMLVLAGGTDGVYKVIAFVPKEIEDVNDIVNELMQRASSAKELGEELEKIGVTKPLPKDSIKSGKEVVAELQQEML